MTDPDLFRHLPPAPVPPALDLAFPPESPPGEGGRVAWFFYVVRCGDGTLYAGVTTDPLRRVVQHNEGTAAKYTRGRGPIILLFSVRCPDQRRALQAEAQFKKMTKEAKEDLVARMAARDADRVRSVTIEFEESQCP